MSDKIMWVLCILVLFTVLFTVCYILLHNSTEEYVGTILDFDVSAGGFLSRDKCKIVTENKTVVCSGFVCAGLETGKELFIVDGDCEVRSK